MCEINHKTKREFKVEFFQNIQDPRTPQEFVDDVTEDILQFEMKVNSVTRVRCHVHDWEEPARHANHKAIDLVLENRLQKETVRQLVELVDKLRQPYNNSQRHELYLLATNKLNDLDDRGQLPRD